jgi:hypothetical protein
VADTQLSEIESTGAFEFGYLGQPVVKMCGRFVGYIGRGCGGAMFFDESGKEHYDPDSEVVEPLL